MIRTTPGALSCYTSTNIASSHPDAWALAVDDCKVSLTSPQDYSL